MSSTSLAAVPKPSETRISYITTDTVLLMNNMSAILAGISLLFCMIVLALITLIARDKAARKCLDRLSFRLIVYSLLSNCIYCIGYIICVKVGPGFWCVAGVWLIQFWLGITNWLITCIAVNLQLVLVHLVDGLKLEKWYLMGTLALNLAITLPPLISHKFGWDPDIKVCWLTSGNTTSRVAWQISTQLLWILLSIFITVVCSLATMWRLYRHKVTSVQVLKEDAALRGSTALNFSQNTLNSRNNSVYSQGDSSASAYRGASQNLMSSAEFRKIILRIALYPVVMVILNLVITIADIQISFSSGVYTETAYATYVVYYTLYGARGMFYALIAILDPSLMRAYRVWRGRETRSTLGTIDGPDTPGLKDPNFSMTYGMAPDDNSNMSGIQVHTDIESYVQESKQRYAVDDPMQLSDLVSPTTKGPTTTIESNRIMPKAHFGSHSDDSINHLPTMVREDDELPFTLEDDNYESSTAELAPVEGRAQTGPLSIEGIRKRQVQRTAQRKQAERDIKRQI